MSELAQLSLPLNTAPVPGSEPGPDTTSSDHKAMSPLWEKVSTFSRGVQAMRDAGEKYLPKLSQEEAGDYADRKKTTPFTNVYEDISGSLASKPFSREVQFEDADEVDERFLKFSEDVDGRGNNMHVFSERVFHEGLDNAIDWILVDHTKLPPLREGQTARSLNEETALGARPYWVRVPGASVIAAYSTMLRDKEVFTHVRVREPALVREGYVEKVVERVRTYEREEVETEVDGVRVKDYAPATWRLEEKRKDPKTDKVYWEIIEQGTVDIGIIPMVPFYTGRRGGVGGWEVSGPLAKLADMQIDAFQQESNLRNIEMLVCYPMLTANGVMQPTSTVATATGQAEVKVRVPVGPRAVLWAPPNPNGGPPGSWTFIEPSAESIKVLQGELDRTHKNMREIGMQPLATTNITVITSANVSVKAKSALQAWALKLKDTLEQALVITALWYGLREDEAPGVDVYKDFGVDLESGKELETLNTASSNGKLSGETLRAEMKRRNVLSDSFDEEEEKVRLAMEAAGEADPALGEEDIDPVTGRPLDAANDEGGDPLDAGAYGSEDDITDDDLVGLFGPEFVGRAV